MLTNGASLITGGELYYIDKSYDTKMSEESGKRYSTVSY